MTTSDFTLIIDGQDYFSAKTSKGYVRIGLVGGWTMDFPVDHPCHARVLACTSEAEVEEIVDEYYAM